MGDVYVFFMHPLLFFFCILFHFSCKCQIVFEYYPKNIHPRIHIANIRIQSKTTRQPYRVLTNVVSGMWRVIPEPVVVQSRFLVFILSLETEGYEVSIAF